MNVKLCKRLRSGANFHPLAFRNYQTGETPVYAQLTLGGPFVKVRKGIPFELSDKCSRYRYKMAKRMHKQGVSA